jgi:hypothetical protein
MDNSDDPESDCPGTDAGDAVTRSGSQAVGQAETRNGHDPRWGVPVLSVGDTGFETTSLER